MNDIHGVYVWTGKELVRPYLLKNRPLHRDGFPVLWKHMNGKPAGRILALSGLRVTGKTTLMLQAVARLPTAELERTVFIPHCTRQQSLLDVLAWCRDNGIARVIVDAITDMEDFTGVAPLLPYARDMIITIAGADTLYFRLETEPNLDVLDMTHVPAREYMRLQNATLQQCVQLGGMLRKPEAWPESSSSETRDAYWTRCCVSHPVRRSLVRLARMREWAAMEDPVLFQTGRLERVLQDVSWQAVLETARRCLRGRDLSQIARLSVETRATSGGTARTALRLLEQAGVLARIREETPERRNGRRWLPVQPGLRHLQAGSFAQVIEHWFGDSRENLLRNDEMQCFLRMLDEDLMLDVILLDTLRAAPGTVRVRSLLLPDGQRAMLIPDMRRRRCAVFVTADDAPSPRQARPLRDRGVIAGLTRRFGAVVRRTVLCRGNAPEENGITWQDARDFLSLLDDPAALDWMCNFTLPDAPAAPVNRGMRRWEMPRFAKLPPPTPQTFTRDSIFDEVQPDAVSLRRLLAGETLPVSLSAGAFWLRAAPFGDRGKKLVEEHLGASFLQETDLVIPQTRLGRVQGLLALLTPALFFTPANLPIFATGAIPAAHEANIRAAARWAAAHDVEPYFWQLAGIDAFMGNVGRAPDSWGLVTDRDAPRLAALFSNRARVLHVEPAQDEDILDVMEDLEDLCVNAHVDRNAMSNELNHIASSWAYRLMPDFIEAPLQSLSAQRFISAEDAARFRAWVDIAVSKAKGVEARLRWVTAREQHV